MVRLFLGREKVRDEVTDNEAEDTNAGACWWSAAEHHKRSEDHQG